MTKHLAFVLVGLGVTLGGTVAAVSHAEGKAAGAQVARVWEYKTIVRSRIFQSNGLTAGSWGDWQTTEDDAPSSGTLGEVLSRAGTRGWELATAAPLEITSSGQTLVQTMYYVLKRPKP